LCVKCTNLWMNELFTFSLLFHCMLNLWCMFHILITFIRMCDIYGICIGQGLGCFHQRFWSFVIDIYKGYVIIWNLNLNYCSHWKIVVDVTNGNICIRRQPISCKQNAKFICSKLDTNQKCFCMFKALKLREWTILFFFKCHFFYQMCTMPLENWRRF
jgi:hypothetical protein